MSTTYHPDLDKLVGLVQNSAKYARISPDLIRSIGNLELERRQNLKEAVKATRGKLHQVGSAYQENPIPYGKWASELGELDHSLNDPGVQAWVRSCLQYHASTRERLPILERIFSETLAPIGPIHSVLDIACGLNPMSIPWMSLERDFSYQAVDIYVDLIEFLNLYFKHFAINGKAGVADVLQSSPSHPVQVALIMKTIPCLEQLDKQAGGKLLDAIQAEIMLVSFPARSLGGRSKGMVQNYEAHFHELIRGKPWKIDRFEFPGELVFRVQTS
jgi:16S rRNA (guanine(1405)-N(7))-methyltransferase